MYEKITAAIAALTLMCVITVIAYNELTEQRATIVLELKPDADPFETFKTLPVKQITEIKSLDRMKNEYEVKVITRHPIADLLKIIMGRQDVKEAHVKESLMTAGP